MTKSGPKVTASAKTGMRISIWSGLIAAVFALITGMPSSAFADPVTIKGWSSDISQMDGTLTVTTTGPGGIPTTQTLQTSGTPPKITVNLDPGTHIFHFEGTNKAGRTEKGVMQYTVVAGAEHKVIINTQVGAAKINQAQSGVTAGGATNTGTASAAPRTTRSGTRVNASLSTGASGTFVDGIDMLAGFNGGNPTGVNALSTSGNNVGTHVAGNVRVKMPAPNIGNWGLGANGMFFNFGGESLWGRSVDKFDMITGSFEAPGLGVLNNALLASIDDVEARTEIDRLEFAAALGFTYNLGPMEAYTLGNLLLGSMGNLGFGNVGNLGSTDRRRKGVTLTTEAEVFYQRTMRQDDVDFGNSGNTNQYMNETEVNRVGLRAGGKVSLPIARGVSYKIGGGLGVYRDDRKLDSSLDRAGTRASANDEDVKIGYEIGFNTSLTAKLGPGRISAYVDYRYESSNPVVHFQAATNDEHGLASTSAHQATGGLKYIIPTSVLGSDIRLKTDIVRLGALPSGLPVYSYKYLWSSETHVGVMAQEARLMFPDAVKEIDSFLTVDYAKIR